METLFYFFIFILGLCIGSFLNCIIYRLSKNESFLKGRSFCVHCKHTLTWMDLIPVFSFLLLHGKCRYCHKKISWQYPIVEISTGLLFLLIFLTTRDLALPSNFLYMIFLLYVTSVLVVIFVYDLRHSLIPDSILFPAIGISFVYRLLDYHNFFNYLLAAFLASVFFLFIFLISRGSWMGFGDVKLAVLLGLVLGFPNILLGLFLAFWFGAIIGVALILKSNWGGLAQGNVKLKSEIPFAPFLITATFVAIFWGNQIIDWYMHLFIF